jgi:sigma-B regulation protein RsbU (phosphoserine phosphatase)
VKLDEHRMACVICDVSGKGVAAAFIMVMIRTILRIIIGKVKGTAAMLRWINGGLMDKTGMDRFATMAVYLFDSRTGTVTYSNAAHHPLLRYNAAARTFEEIDTNGLPLGVERKAEYEEIEFKVAEGDLLILFSDGVSELKNERGSMFGVEALKNSIAAHASENARTIAESVRSDLARFMGQAKRFDDTSFLVLKIGDRTDPVMNQVPSVAEREWPLFRLRAIRSGPDAV